MDESKVQKREAVSRERIEEQDEFKEIVNEGD